MSTVMETRPHVTSRDVVAGDLHFRLHEAGTPGAETVLFLHGSGPGATGASNWARVIDDLADRYYCLAPDNIGFGSSSHPDPAPVGMAPFNEVRADALLDLLDTLGLGKVHVVGNSMGGSLALLMLQRAPERFDKVVLLGSGGAPGRPTSPGLVHLRQFYENPSDDSLRGLLQEFVFDIEALAGQIDQTVADRMSYIRRDDVQRSHRGSFDPSGPRRSFGPEELAAITHEVLAIHGRDDRIIPVSSSRYFAQHLPNARLYEIGRCGHWTQIEHPETFELLVTRFLSGRL